jgi:hypothetical protein
MLNSIAGLLLHLRENIADNLGWVVGCLLRARYLETKKKTKYEQERYIERVISIGKATHIDGDVAELRPAHSMVHVVFAKVVFRQVGDVGLLDMRDVV